jgi:2-polyprenyl-3-methyl-5-hydroxy-6-metoxy-1,4-benzoquinol methylase
MKRDFDAAAKTWDQNEARRRMSHAIGDAMVSALSLSGTETILDYGAGTGLVTMRLQPLAREIIAADSSRGMLEMLEQKVAASGTANVRTTILDLEHEAPSKAGIHPDVIVSAMTMHHIADTSRFAAALFELLSPGGGIAIADLDTESGEFHADRTGVEHFGFDRDALVRIFSEAGFQSVQVQTACETTRPNAAGVETGYSIFLLTGRKPQRH